MRKAQQHAIWGRRGTFILAATGSAVGLGNIWKFPYITGENGGGAFVVMYLLCICLIGLPVLVAEIMLGRRGRASPILAMQRVARESNSSKLWSLIGWSGVLAGFIILSYYSVIAGWTLEYVTTAARGGFEGFDGVAANNTFTALQGDISTLVQWQTAFLCMTALIIMFGVTRGLETAVRILMPLLFCLLVVLLGYAAYAGDFAAGFNFLFKFRFDQLSLEGLSLALGHAFFTLSLSMGAIMAYGSYMPHNQSILKTAATVGVLDTAIALLAGLVIFPIVFANPGIEPGAGPGLMFVSLPIVFGAMPLGEVFGTVFFLLVTLAAWSSTISLLEPAVAYLTERFRFHRVAANLLIIFCAWLLGLTTVFSLNRWQDLSLVAGMTPFDLSTFITEQVLLPLGALATAIYVGWFMKKRPLRRELALDSSRWFVRWLTVLKYVSPMLIAVVFVLGIVDKFAG
ncbi:sodium-dependent transporter [Gilvimarinus agarilyticus]|uniref:sodium-dependent transporter n=1 Tax=Gilvimarinus sp. 2_MG-2023 TaxID=3062666 RepID=UPI001C0984FD|nr:sodium-dependent transporter [Gilvimarinus sp. 2_MG-2023]MBU2884479.1 sodium-dependent transporter [Gilvimarinus agarilyticus]MDO6569615.1 sodium-dependent transporter [Gilvimarinus sp. 2_MG-2023]